MCYMSDMICYISDMFYNVVSILEQCYKEPICCKYVPSFCIMTILLIDGPRNTHPVKFTSRHLPSES